MEKKILLRLNIGMNFRQLPVSIRRFLWLAFFFCTALVVAKRNWLHTRFPIQMDANGYYIYLPAVFIYDDLKHLDFVKSMPEQFDRKYFLYPSQTGGYLTKYSPGIAIFEAPFFFVAHGLSKVLDWPDNGYEPAYRLALCIANLVYTFLGLAILGLILVRFFSERVSLICLFLTLFGTNFFFFTTLQIGLSHNYLFAAFAWIFFWGLRWFDSGKWTAFALSCFGVGVATLIRPTEGLSGLVLIGFFLFKWLKEKDKLAFLAKQIPSFLSGFMAFLLPLIPLVLYWKFATGHWIAYTYEDEGFYFDRPQTIWYGLFGFRKGWFIYTPLMFFTFFGLWLMRNDARFGMLRMALWLYMPLNIFLVLSWYCWWYGGGFGMRPFIPSLVFLAVPLAVLIEKAIQSAFRFRILLAAFGLIVGLNIFQSYQYQQQIIHMDAMTWEAYRFVFGKVRLSEEEKAAFQKMLEHPGFLERGKKLDEYFK